jgi:hypothetical protein
MTISSLIIVLFIFILSGLIILRPFLDGSADDQIIGSSSYDSLIAERERLLSAIEELDLELELDKISSQEYSRNRDLLLVEAAGVLKKLEKTKKPVRSKSQAAVQEASDDELERMIARRRLELKQDASRVCSNCQKQINPEDQFCSYCGAKQ